MTTPEAYPAPAANPLVRNGKEAAATEGAGLFHDATEAVTGFADGNGAEGLLNVASAAGSVGTFLADPLAGLFSAGFGWLVEHVGFLREPLDWLTGDQQALDGMARTWSSVPSHLSETSGLLKDAVTKVVRDIVRDLISEAIGKLISSCLRWAPAVARSSTLKQSWGCGVAFQDDRRGDEVGSVPSWVAAFDHLAPGIGDVIHERTAELREASPVARSSAYGGFFVVAGAREVDLVAKDDDTFSSAVEGLGATMVLPTLNRVTAPLFESDRPAHTVWRRAMQPFFTPAAAAGYEPGIRRVTREVLAGLAPRGRADLVADFAAVVPSWVTATVLGVPEDRRAETAALIRQLFAAADPEQAGARLAEVLAEWVRERRGAPVRDVFGAVVNTAVDGVPATDDELLKHAFLMLAAGTLTAGDTIANTAYVLGSDARLRARVSADRTLLGAVVEESVRHESAVAATGRTVRHDTRLAGEHLKAGDRLLLLWGSANRDRTLFDDADRFRLDRPRPTRHLGWGAGAHHCLGKYLARLQVRAVLDELLEVLGDFEVEPGFTPQRTFGVLRGLTALPVRWTP